MTVVSLDFMVANYQKTCFSLKFITKFLIRTRGCKKKTNRNQTKFSQVVKYLFLLTIWQISIKLKAFFLGTFKQHKNCLREVIKVCSPCTQVHIWK